MVGIGRSNAPVAKASSATAMLDLDGTVLAHAELVVVEPRAE